MLTFITQDRYEKWTFYTQEQIDGEMFSGPWTLGFSGTWESVETPGAHGSTYVLKDHPFEVLYLTPAFSQIHVLETPIEVIVR